MQTGQINVTAENIFPIIKKFLYTDQEIFLRELVSNAIDAIQKLNVLSSLGQFKGELGDLKVEISSDDEKNTISIKDNGIGMTYDEIDKYINQIAFSSAEEFLEKFKDKGDASKIIGKFGLGFYSSFLVADKVEIFTKTYKKGKGTKAVKWECEGTPEYNITEVEKKERGTEVVLHIAEESKDFLQEAKVKELLDKYCKFLPIPIKFGTTSKTEKDEDGNEVEVIEDKIINNTSPLWTKLPVDSKEEEYKKFYKELYPYSTNDPLFWIHLNIDYPFYLTGILYFPKFTKESTIQKDRIKLYSNQVFVTDQLEEVIPKWLVMLEGVIDSPDIPLNVSRSMLQSDRNVKKIGNYITKKIADKLEELFKTDQKVFEKQWKDIKMVVQYGMIWDEKFFERARTFCLLKNTEDKFFTLDQYKQHIENLQTDKNDKLIYIYTTDSNEQHSFIESAKKKGYDVLCMDEDIDIHFIDKLEKELDKVSFVRVDADTLDKLIDKDEETVSQLSKKEEEELKSIIEENIDRQQFTVSIVSMDSNDYPMTITKPEFNRRMQSMNGFQISAMQGIGGFGGLNQLVVNMNHPLMLKILKSKSKKNRQKYVKQCLDLALLLQNMLKGESLTSFVNRSVELIKA